jgi:methoxymalonate biosynthesis protein
MKLLKCLIWDLDNTLWHGILSEGDELTLNTDAMQALTAAESKGIVQSIASCNDEQTALDKLESLGLKQYFLYPKISQGMLKNLTVKDIIAHFNVRPDSVCFIDDDPFELSLINHHLPQVFTCSPSDIPSLTEHIKSLAKPSGDRGTWMKNREARMTAEHVFTGTHAEFLAGCDMRLAVREAAAEDLPRAAELASRANKINNLPASLANKFDIMAYSKQPNHVCYVCELTDRFGCHGIVGAGLFRADGAVLHIDLFCVSCRVEGRGIANAFLREVMQRIPQGIREASCKCENAREGMALLLLKSLGFAITAWEGGTVHTRLTLPFQTEALPWVTIIN